MSESRVPFDPNKNSELEIVQEHSIVSETTYKSSLMDTDTYKPTAKSNNKFGLEGNMNSKKQLFMKTANFGSEKSLIKRPIDSYGENCQSEMIERLHERLSSKNNLISQLKDYQFQLSEAYERVKAEVVELKEKLKYSEYQSPRSMQYPSKDDYEMLTKEIESLITQCNLLKSSNEKLVSEKEFLKSKLKSTKEEVDYLSNQILSSGNEHFNDFKLKEKIRALETENSKLKSLKSPLASAYSSKMGSRTSEEFSITKSLQKRDYQSQKDRKFTEACSNLMVSCFPSEFEREKPSLKQVWRWIKGVIEDFVRLNKVFGELQEMLGAQTIADVFFRIERFIQ